MFTPVGVGYSTVRMCLQNLLAKRAKQSIKNTGKGTDTTYRGKGAGRVEVTGKKTEPKGPTKALPAAKKTNQVSGSPQRKALPSGSSSIVKRKDTRPKAPRPSSGIQPVKVRVIDDKKLKPSNQKQLPPAKKSLHPSIVTGKRKN